MINNSYVHYRNDLPETYEQALKFMDRIFWRMSQYNINNNGIIARACGQLTTCVNNKEEYVSTYRGD